MIDSPLGSARTQKMVWGYGRGSTDKQLATCEVQHANVKQWFLGQKASGQLKDYEFGGWFDDFATTSKIPWFQRPGAQKMLINCQPGDMIVVAIYDRAIRSTKDACQCIEDLDQFGLAVKFLDNPMIDTTTIDGQAMFRILSALAERERALIGRRTKERYSWARSEGRPINGKAPPGWKVVRDKGGLPVYAPDGEERDLIERRIIPLREEEGLSFEKIMWRLRKEGFRNKYKRTYFVNWIRYGYHAAKAGYPHPGTERQKLMDINACHKPLQSKEAQNG